MRYFPHVWETDFHTKKFGPVNREVVDLSSCEVVRDDVVYFAMSYERADRQDLTPPSDPPSA